MAMHNLSTSVKTVRVANAAAAAQTTVTCTVVDTLGYAGVRFVALAGTITDTSVCSLKVQQSSDNNVLDDFTDIAGSKASWKTTADSNNMVATDIFRPQKRYLQAIVSRGTANMALDGVLCELYRAEEEAAAVDATVSSQKILSNPAEGTA